MKNRKSLVPTQKITYTFPGQREAVPYLKTLMRENYVFTVLPYTDCVRVETYTAAPAPISTVKASEVSR